MCLFMPRYLSANLPERTIFIPKTWALKSCTHSSRLRLLNGEGIDMSSHNSFFIEFGWRHLVRQLHRLLPFTLYISRRVFLISVWQSKEWKETINRICHNISEACFFCSPHLVANNFYSKQETTIPRRALDCLPESRFKCSLNTNGNMIFFFFSNKYLI